MPGCVLRADGEAFDPGAFLSRFPIPGASVRGAGFSALVSDRPGDDLPGQCCDAVSFLRANAAALRELTPLLGTEGVALDFGVWRKDTLSQYLRFPAELVALAGALCIGLEISVYAANDS